MTRQNVAWYGPDAAMMPASGPVGIPSLKHRQPGGRRFRVQTLERGECGESLVSFALTVPILFGLIFGLMQLCMALYSHEYISELAREGARYAIVHGPDCLTSSGTSCMVTATSSAGSFPSVNDYVLHSGLPNFSGGKVTVSTTYPNGEAVNQPVLVKVTCAFPFQIPFVTSTTLAMSSSSEMYIIQ
jgi:Flp pilus assembly protein TadG